MSRLNAKIYRIHKDAIIPSRQSEDAAGYDLHTLVDFTLRPGGHVVVSTGLVVQPPPGYHTEILIRSGLAYKYNIMLRNGVGLIDRDYAGPEDEIKLMLYRAADVRYVGENPHIPDKRPVSFKKGDRIAQMVFRQTELLNLVEVSEPPKSDDRGGLGSTGV